MSVLRKLLRRASDCILCLVQGTFPFCTLISISSKAAGGRLGRRPWICSLLSSLPASLTLSPPSKPLFSLPLPLFLPSHLL